MKILDSYNNVKWNSSGSSFLKKSIMMSAKSKLSTNILNFKKANIKIIGRKVSGNGIVNLYIKKKSGEILFYKEIKFTKSSWSEYSFDCKDKAEDCVIEFSRSKNSFGRVEVGRILVKNDEVIVVDKKKNTKFLENTGQLEFYLQNISLNKKIAVVVPYGIYGGGEVYLKNIFSKIKKIFKIEFLYLSKNRLNFELSGDNIRHKRVRTLSQLSSALINNKYDTVVFYNSKKVYNLISELKKNKKIISKVIEIYHSDFLWADAIAGSDIRSGVDLIFKVSDGLAANIEGVSDENKVLMPVGIDTEKFIRKENIELKKELAKKDKTVFGIIARLSPEKNIEYALRLVKGMDKIQLLVIGSGPLDEALQRFAEENNIDNVSFLGYKKNVADYYNIFDAFLLTSKMEGTPISILEAMSCCLPIYSTGVGQISENFANLDNFNILTGSLELDREIISKQVDAQNYYQNLREYIIDNHNIEIISNRFFDNLGNSLPNFKEKDPNATALGGEYI